MALYAMPIIMANLGTEMVYILEQRLKAQQIPSEKGNKVLKDVVETMFNPIFYSEVIRPQEVYNISSTRQIFDRLAHSSIMRLSTASMDKLYDLMLMGLKYQVLCTRKAEDILGVTMLHLQAIKDCVGDDSVRGMVDDIIQKMNAIYSRFKPHHWAQLRQTMARFFKDKRVKVSLFLQEGIQHLDGKILLPLPLPQNPNDPQPGTVRIHSGSGVTTKTVPLASVEVDTADFHCHPHPLGANLYDKSRPPFKPPKKAGGAVGAAVLPSQQVNSPKAGEFSSLSETIQQPSLGNAEALLAAGLGDAGKVELNALAQMIAPRKTAGDNFKLNLFPDDNKDTPATTTGASFIEPSVKTINIGPASENANRKHLDNLMSDLDLGPSGNDGDDDLLDLMDRAS